MPKAKQKAAPITSVTIKYDLFDLPTAQHKAGLAGLLLQIQDMATRAKTDHSIPAASIPVVVAQTATSATITFTAEAVQGLMDDLYAAQVVEVTVKTKWPKQTPKREEEVEETDERGESRKVKRFIYDVTQPSGKFLQGRLRDEKGAWIKLWRDMLWSIPRGIPMTRLPFEQRAAGERCKEGQAAWQDLVKAEQARRNNGFHTATVASSLWLGAQATNAELIPFEGRAEQNLLLHSWPLTVLIFAPQQINFEGTGDFVGYVLAIPEVADLDAFLSDYPQMLGELGKEVRGYRPAEAVIDLPAQGALAFLEHLARLSSEKATDKLRYSVDSVEFLHLAKLGNTIKSLAAGRVAPRPGLLERYQAIVGRPGEEPPYRNPLFRRGLMLALLNDQDWYEPMASMLVEAPWPFFIRSEHSPSKLPWFWQDAAKRFEDLAQQYDMDQREYQEMAKANPGQGAGAPETPLPLLIHRLVQTYVLRRTEEKCGLKWEDFKNKKVRDEKTGKERVDVPQAYREAKEHVASSIFLEMRSRREQAFVDHFVGTFGSVKQYLPEDDFQTVAEALLKKPEDVKTITLLALSANS
jgi:CRISPR-associated protein Cmx8